MLDRGIYVSFVGNKKRQGQNCPVLMVD